MNYEEIEVRISKSGEIYVTVRGGREERIRDYRSFLEEMVGPVKSMSRIDSPDWEKPAEIVEEEERRRDGEIRVRG